MPITVNFETLARATRMPDAKLLRDEMAGCAEFLHFRPTLQQLTGAFIRAFEEYFEVELQDLKIRV